MFTGLIEKVGSLKKIESKGDAVLFTIIAENFLEETQVGDSIAVDGICLTVVHRSTDSFAADAVKETLGKTTLGTKRVGERVNLEKALLISQRLGGHIVQGHIDGVGKIQNIQPLVQGVQFTVKIPDDLADFVVKKGSIAIDGISLTVADIDSTTMTIAVIPHTFNSTTLKLKRTGDTVNIEVDILAKYVQKMIAPHDALSMEKLKELGF